MRLSLEQPSAHQDDETDRKLTIEGSPGGVKRAEQLVQEILNGADVNALFFDLGFNPTTLVSPRFVQSPGFGRSANFGGGSGGGFGNIGHGGDFNGGHFGGGVGGFSNVGSPFARSNPSNYNHRYESARQSGRGLEVEVPGFAVGKIIGKGGEQIRQLTDTTGARIQFNRGDCEWLGV